MAWKPLFMLRVTPSNEGAILSGAEPFEPARGPTETIEGGDKGGWINDPGEYFAPPFSLRPKLEDGL
jgi:hypothetical protein